MSRPRKDKFPGWLPGLYAKATKTGFVFYTLVDGKYHGLGGAINEARTRLVALQNGTPTPDTVGDLLDQYHAHRWDLHRKSGGKTPALATLKGNEAEIARLKTPFGNLPIGEFKRAFAWDYLHKYRGAKAPVRANREIAYLGGAFEFAIDRDKLAHNPVHGVEYNPETSRDRLVTHEELISYCQFAIGNKHHAAASSKKDHDAGLRIALALQLAYIVARPLAQILRIPAKGIDGDGIDFPGRKRGHSVRVTYTPVMREIIRQLQELPAAAQRLHLVCRPDGCSYQIRSVRTMCNRIMNAWLKDDTSRQRFRPHDLRAKGISKLKEDGRQASELTGHTTEAMANKVYDRRKIRTARAVE